MTPQEFLVLKVGDTVLRKKFHVPGIVKARRREPKGVRVRILWSDALCDFIESYWWDEAYLLDLPLDKS